jgi:hypothetical protein
VGAAGARRRHPAFSDLGAHRLRPSYAQPVEEKLSRRSLTQDDANRVVRAAVRLILSPKARRLDRRHRLHRLSVRATLLPSICALADDLYQLALTEHSRSERATSK